MVTGPVEKRVMGVVSGHRDRDGKVTRRAKRCRLFMPAELRGAAGNHQGYLLDLSISGGQVRVSTPPMAGTIVTLTSGGIARAARVAWVNDRRIGLAFISPLSAAEVDQVIASSEEGSPSRREPG